MDDQTLTQLAHKVGVVYAGELSTWDLVWLKALEEVKGLEADCLVAGVPFTGRQIARALLSELPLPRSPEQEEVCRHLMGMAGTMGAGDE